jgi:acyl carrier protein
MRRFLAGSWLFCAESDLVRMEHPVGSFPVQATGLEATVRSVVAQQLSVPPDTLTGDSQLEELGLDDHAALLVLAAVEDKLDVRFPDDFLDGLQTYGELAAAVRIAVRG